MADVPPLRVFEAPPEPVFEAPEDCPGRSRPSKRRSIVRYLCRGDRPLPMPPLARAVLCCEFCGEVLFRREDRWFCPVRLHGKIRLTPWLYDELVAAWPDFGEAFDARFADNHGAMPDLRQRLAYAIAILLHHEGAAAAERWLD